MNEPNRCDAVFALVGGDLLYNAGLVTCLSGQVEPTEEAIQAKLTELQAEYDAQLYARNRASAYDSIGNQLDMLFHDMTAGKGTKTGEWYKAISKVKSDNPKPE